MASVIVCLGVVALFVGFQLRFAKRKRDLNKVSWDDLVACLHPLNVTGLQEVAGCYLHPGTQQLRIEPGSMWEAVGGLSGIQKLNSNVEVMLQLAMYAERWNDVNGRVLSEIRRRDAAPVRACVQQ